MCSVCLEFHPNHTEKYKMGNYIIDLLDLIYNKRDELKQGTGGEKK